MYSFDAIYSAKTTRQALEYLDRYPKACVIAGGSDVLIKLRNGKLPQATLVSIQQVDELRGIRIEPDGTLCILPLTCFTDLRYSPILAKTVPVLAQAAAQVGGPQIQNIGTIGGNLCNGATSADSASTLLALDAQLELTCINGSRICPIHTFYLGPGKVALRPGELLTAIRIPKTSYEGYFGVYMKYAMRRAMDIATLGCSLNVRLNQDRTHLDDLRIAFGVAGPTPLRALQTEAKFRGQPITHSLCQQVEQAVLTELNPRDSWRASRQFRLSIAQEITARALQQSLILAGGDALWKK